MIGRRLRRHAGRFRVRLRQAGSRSRLALVVAYMLVLQAMLGATLLGASAAADASGLPVGVICGPGDPAAVPARPQSPAPSAHPLDCCTAACPMVAPLAAPASDGPGLPPLLPRWMPSAPAAPGRPVAGLADHTLPNPRAPPRIA
jgi:hypothetical protein